VNTLERIREVVVDDGSKVWLNSNAPLSFPKKFGYKERNVTLTGEAFFEVAKDPDKPFVIKMPSAYVQVLGTSFNINSDAQNAMVTVATGKVKVSDSNNKSSVIIVPGYSATVKGNKVEKHETNNLNYLSWKTGRFIFDKTPIKQVVEDLNTYYEKQIIIGGEATIDCKLTATFEDTALEEIIEILRLTCDVKVLNGPDNYVIR
jgi:ferric-dicitrate binding protein FerR (iron transport regulator)